MMSTVVVIYDACVLYPAPLRDFLMHVALTDLYRAKWTSAIHDEWIGNLLKSRSDLDPEKLQRTRQLMDEHVLDCLVTGYEPLIPQLSLPDPDDRHVLAAAIQSGANVILTFNFKDFPPTVLEPYGIAACHPDEFLRHQLDGAPGTVCLAASRHRATLKHPPKDVQQYLVTLAAQGLTQTAEGLREFASLI